MSSLRKHVKIFALISGFLEFFWSGFFKVWITYYCIKRFLGDDWSSSWDQLKLMRHLSVFTVFWVNVTDWAIKLAGLQLLLILKNYVLKNSKAGSFQFINLCVTWILFLWSIIIQFTKLFDLTEISFFKGVQEVNVMVIL